MLNKEFTPRSPRGEGKEQSLYKIFEERNYLCELCGLAGFACLTLAGERFLKKGVHAKVQRKNSGVISKIFPRNWG
jgi:hypothetical protein